MLKLKRYYTYSPDCVIATYYLYITTRLLIQGHSMSRRGNLRCKHNRRLGVCLSAFLLFVEFTRLLHFKNTSISL